MNKLDNMSPYELKEIVAQLLIDNFLLTKELAVQKNNSLTWFTATEDSKKELAKLTEIMRGK